MKTCVKCKLEKSETEFPSYKKGPRAGNLYDYCKDCYTNYANEAKLKRKAKQITTNVIKDIKKTIKETPMDEPQDSVDWLPGMKNFQLERKIIED